MSRASAAAALPGLLRRLRALLHGEVPRALHPSVSHLQEEFVHQVGMPFTAQFERYLSHPDHWGQTRPGMASILEVSEWCHGKHTSHILPGQARSLCAQLVYEVAYIGKEVNEVALHHALPQMQTESMLVTALTHAEEWRNRPPRLMVDYDGDEPLAYEPLNRTAA